ncbi:MAG: HNH endonuclease [Actinomycetia bacterium]|nr:HNH endonuclease [Actinomycetes bacterium]
MQNTIKNRTVFCRDNLEILRGIDDDSIDLIYLDPPFNKKKQFTAPIGSTAEGASFRDIFHERDVKAEWIGLIADQFPVLAEYLQGVDNIGHKSNKPYLCYMAIRLMELRRVLKPTGSIYLHCDPTMSHYLKLLLDCIFGERNFQNEVVWKYRSGGASKNRFARKHDLIYLYSKTGTYSFNVQREPYDAVIAESRKDKFHPEGKMVSDVWDISIPSFSSKERVGYPTQKPIALLERIITVSSNKGDVVLDPFCGCATTLVAAERLQRQWIGIDISQKAYELVKDRLSREIDRPNEMFSDKTYHRTDIPQCTHGGPLPSPTTHKHFLYGNQEGYCNGCKTHFNYRNLEVDHIVPRAKGGADNIENLQLLCGHCNRIKGDRDMPFLMARLQERR